MNPTVRRRIDQIRQRWWLVLVITVLATLTALQPLLLSKPTYAATSTLVLSSPGRNPVEDAAMAVGYATLLNQPATIDRLKAARHIPADVKFEARTVGASPILTVEATAKDPTVAQDSAQDMAEAFRDDVNSVRHARKVKAIQDRQAELDALLARPGPEGLVNPMAPIVQEELSTLRADTTDQLQELQLQAGVDKVDTQIPFQFAARVLGGLVLGVLAALGLSALSNRVTNSADLQDKTGIKPLVEVPAGGSTAKEQLREERLRALANIVSLQELPKSTVVALTDCHGARGARDLAEALARLSSEQGNQTVLVYADNAASRGTAEAGFNDVLADHELVGTVLTNGTVDSLNVMHSGSVLADRYPLMSRENIAAVFDELRMNADVIVVAAPSIADTIDAQTICAASDLSVIVIGKDATRARDVTAAVDALADTHAVLLGAVLIDGAKRRSRR